MEITIDVDERYQRYLRERGWFFASNPDMHYWAENEVKEGRLKNILEIIDTPTLRRDKNTWKYSYFPMHFCTIEDLLTVFNETGLNAMGIFSHNMDYEI